MLFARIRFSLLLPKPVTLLQIPALLAARLKDAPNSPTPRTAVLEKANAQISLPTAAATDLISFMS